MFPLIECPFLLLLISEIRCVFPEVQGVKKAIKGNTYRSGTNITLECDDGYTLEGISQIQCQEDFSWDPPIPACKLSEWNVNKAKSKQKHAKILLNMQIYFHIKNVHIYNGVVFKKSCMVGLSSKSLIDTVINYRWETPCFVRTVCWLFFLSSLQHHTSLVQ